MKGLLILILLASLLAVSCATLDTGKPDVLEPIPESPMRPMN